ncbi:MAG: sulfotransferase family 2 domain-containing protein, partial [Methylococcales bacterium]
MISEQYRFIFVHIPKTAGNALQSILTNYSGDSLITRANKDGIHRFGVENALGTTKHSTLSDYFAALGPHGFWTKRRFACIRNPWDRAVSFYFSSHRGRSVWDRNEFIQVLDEIHPMVDYLRLPNDPPALPPDINIDFLLRYERLQEDFDRLCNMLRFDKQPLAVRNPSERLSYP